MGEIRCWYRLHANGWIAAVRLCEANKVTYSSRPISAKGFGFRPAPDVQSAQRWADERVAAHECGETCGQWFEGVLPDSSEDR